MNGKEKSRTFLSGGSVHRDMSPQCPDPHVPQKTTLQKLIKIIEASSGSDSLMSIDPECLKIRIALRDTGALLKGEKSWQRQAQHKYISAFPSRHTRRDIAGLHKGFLVCMCLSLIPNIHNIKV